MFLILRNKHYHFRVKVPIKLVPVLDKCEFKTSLRLGSNRPLAKKIASRLASDCRYVTDRLTFLPEAILMKLDSTTLNKIISNHIRGVVAHYSRYHAVSGITLQRTLDQIENVINNTKAAIKFGLHHDWMKGSLEQAVRDMGLEIDDEQRKQLAFQLAQAHVQGLEKAKDAVTGAEPFEYNEQAHGPLADQQEAEPDVSKSSITLSSLIDQYRQHQLSTGTWRSGSDRDANAKLNALLSYFNPDTQISDLSVDPMRSYVRLLQALPPNYSKMKAYRDKPLHEFDPKELVKNHPRQLDVTTVRDYMTLTRSLFEYAVGLGLLEKNPCPNLLIPKKKKGSAREQTKAYTIEQLHEIFKPDRFLTWVQYGGGFDPAKFWIPVLALCSTGRLEEICGLRVVDIEHLGERRVNLNIAEHCQRLIKNENSDRVVPVVPVIADRLLQYTESLPQDSLLFPGLKPANGKLSHNFSKQWSRYVRKKAGIDDPKISPMHSLRHYVIDLLYKALVPVQVIKAMDGHAPGGGETGGRYAKGLAVDTLRELCVPVIEETLEPILKLLIR